MTMYEVGVAIPLRCMKCKNASLTRVFQVLHFSVPHFQRPRPSLYSYLLITTLIHKGKAWDLSQSAFETTLSDTASMSLDIAGDTSHSALVLVLHSPQAGAHASHVRHKSWFSGHRITPRNVAMSHSWADKGWLAHRYRSCLVTMTWLTTIVNVAAACDLIQSIVTSRPSMDIQAVVNIISAHA